MGNCVFTLFVKFAEDERRDNVKKAKYSWYVTLESESPVPTDEDEESIYTVQGNETGKLFITNFL